MDYLFTVVIVTFNRITLLRECLECVMNQNYPINQVVIVDNASSDGTREYLEKITKTDDRVTVFRSPENRGGAYAFCKGLEIACGLTGNMIILIDDDAMLSKTFTERMVKAFIDNSDVKAFAGVVYNEGKIDTSHRKVIYNWEKLDSREVEVEKYQKEYFKVDLVSFCGLAISRELISQVGYPCAEYFIWYDDTEYSLRLRKETDIVVVSQAELNHKAVIGRGKGNWKLYYGERNMLITVRKHGTDKGYKQVVRREIIKLLKNIFSIKKFLKWLLGKDNTYFYYNFLYIRALIDGVCGRNGKNENYLPK